MPLNGDQAFSRALQDGAAQNVASKAADAGVAVPAQLKKDNQLWSGRTELLLLLLLLLLRFERRTGG